MRRPFDVASGAAVPGCVSYAAERELEMASGVAVRGAIERAERRIARDLTTLVVIAGAFALGLVAWVRWMIGMAVLGSRSSGFRARCPAGGKRARSVLIGLPAVAVLIFIIGLFIGAGGSPSACWAVCICRRDRADRILAGARAMGHGATRPAPGAPHRELAGWTRGPRRSRRGPVLGGSRSWHR